MRKARSRSARAPVPAAGGADAVGAIGGEPPEEVLGEHQLGIEVGLEERIAPGARGIGLILVGIDDDGLRDREDALGQEVERMVGGRRRARAGRATRRSPRRTRRQGGAPGAAGAATGTIPGAGACRRRRRSARHRHELGAHAPHRPLDGGRVGTGFDGDDHRETRTRAEGRDVAADQAPVEAGQRVVSRRSSGHSRPDRPARELLHPPGFSLQPEADRCSEVPEAATGAADGLPHRAGEAAARWRTPAPDSIRRAGQVRSATRQIPSAALRSRPDSPESKACMPASRVRRRDRRRGARRCRGTWSAPPSNTTSPHVEDDGAVGELERGDGVLLDDDRGDALRLDPATIFSISRTITGASLRARRGGGASALGRGRGRRRASAARRRRASSPPASAARRGAGNARRGARAASRGAAPPGRG